MAYLNDVECELALTGKGMVLVGEDRVALLALKPWYGALRAKRGHAPERPRTSGRRVW